ncbi:hypothetical protein IJ00_20640 [Calothrix sp. 336/3]|nr:hypothetical protein IJ00_20640 [Calothrix sp. 336/3]
MYLGGGKLGGRSPQKAAKQKKKISVQLVIAKSSLPEITGACPPLLPLNWIFIGKMSILLLPKA